jgi:hypothetical protein
MATVRDFYYRGHRLRVVEQSVAGGATTWIVEVDHRVLCGEATEPEAMAAAYAKADAIEEDLALLRILSEDPLAPRAHVEGPCFDTSTGSVGDRVWTLYRGNWIYGVVASFTKGRVEVVFLTQRGAVKRRRVSPNSVVSALD